VLTASIALYEAFGERCDVAAGHSLGEYSAHVAAGSIDFGEAVRLVRRRGQYMQEAVPVGKGAMAAAMRADAETVHRICEETEGVVEPVNYNSPGQIVIAGETEAVAKAAERIRALPAKARQLPVSAPFHCQLMRPAEQQLKPHLDDAAFKDPAFPVYVNVEAAPITQGDAARQALIQQVSRPVLWQQSVERMIADGVELFVEIGPGKVLSGLIGRINKRIRRTNIESPQDFPAAREAINEVRAG
jgi:[acyl-carrier-protein] S-malonyltransferase